MITIINVKLTDPPPENYVFIGRPSIYGNPYSVKEYGREKALDMYRKYLWKCIKDNNILIKHISELPDNAVLGCFCVPKDCHGEIIINCWKWLKGKQ